MRDDAPVFNRVIETLDRYYWAFASRDIDLMRDVFDADESFLAFGTDTGEFWVGWDSFEAFSRRLFLVLTDARFERHDLQVRLSADGDTAWFAEVALGHFTTRDQVVEETLRTSGVMTRQGDEWRIVHFHRSVPIKGVTVAIG